MLLSFGVKPNSGTPIEPNLQKTGHRPLTFLSVLEGFFKLLLGVLSIAFGAGETAFVHKCLEDVAFNRPT